MEISSSILKEGLKVFEQDIEDDKGKLNVSQKLYINDNFATTRCLPNLLLNINFNF